MSDDETFGGFPAELAAVDADGRGARVEIDEALYPLDAVYGAAYVFIDRAYVLLDRPAPGRVRVTLAQKDERAPDPRALVGEFANELLSCAWRARITGRNRASIEAVTARAFAGALGPPSLDDLASFDFSAETFDDPLGIAMSWEEKYRKKKPEPEGGGGDGGGGGGGGGPGTPGTPGGEGAT